MATANEIPAMWDLAIFGSFFILGFFGVYGVCLFRGNGKMRENGRVIVCLARALLATPFGPSAMRFLRTSQCFGSHDPFLSRPPARRPPARRPPARRPPGRREAVSERMPTVSGALALGVVRSILAGRCLAVIPRLPCLIWAMPEDGPPGKVRRFCGRVIAWLCSGTG